MTPQSQKDLAALVAEKAPIAQIIEEVEDAFGVVHGTCISKSQKAFHVRARHAAMYICKQEGYNCVEIADVMEVDRTTVMNGVNKVQDRLGAINEDFIYIHPGHTRGVAVTPEDFGAVAERLNKEPALHGGTIFSGTGRHGIQFGEINGGFHEFQEDFGELQIGDKCLIDGKPYVCVDKHHKE